MNHIPSIFLRGCFFCIHLVANHKFFNMRKGYMLLAALSFSGLIGAQISNSTKIYRFDPSIKDDPNNDHPRI